MKKIIISLCLISFIIMGCSDTKKIEGIEYDTYGLLNQYDNKNQQIEYKLCWGNLIWGALLFETIIAPIYFYGFDLFEPVGKKPDSKGSITNS